MCAAEGGGLNQRQANSIRFHVVYWAVVLAGGGLIAYLLQARWPEGLPWAALAAFFAFLIVADSRLGESLATGGRVMSSKCIVLSVIALFGAAPAAAMEVVSALVRGVFLQKKGLRKTVFNAAMLGAAAGTAGVVYEALPWSRSFTNPQFVVPLAAAMLVHSLVNHVLLGSVLSLNTQMSFQRVYRRGISWARLRHLLDLPFAAVVILLYQQAGAWTLVLFGFLVLALYQSDRLYQRNREAHINSIAALTTALEADEPYTHGHSYRVAKYAVMLGKALGMSDRDLETLEYGGLLHDIGKIAITNEIICKPGRLTESEFAVIKSHSTIGADIVEQIKFLSDATELVRHHHERPDGKGYPHGLTLDEISLGCAILNVCDAFDAMSSDRPYRKALSVEQAMEELVRFKGIQFDARVVDCMLALFQQGEFDSLRKVLTDAVPITPLPSVVLEPADAARDSETTLVS